ncbi:MAG: hypothetical protein N3F63_00985 [Thermoplasmata archaeon]|nr:hypothetical protein [Thermoplasmata archaeon]
MTGKEVLTIGLVLGIAMLLSLPVGAGAPAQVPDTPGHSGGWDSGLNWSKPEDANKMWQERCRETRYFGWINYSDGNAKGRFVEFKFNETTGEISDYAVKVYSKTGDVESYKLFDSVRPGFGVSEVRVMGSIFMARGAEGMLIVHDNPAGVIHHMARNASEIDYVVAPDFYVTSTYRNQTFANVVWILSNLTNLTGSVIAGNGTLVIENNTVKVTLAAGQSSFRVHAMHRYGHPRLELQYALGRIGAEISISKREGVVLDDISVYRNDIGAEIREMTEERLRLRVEGEGEGTVIAVTLENQVRNLEHIRIRMDGAEMKKVTVEEVFGAMNGEGRYAAIQDDAGNPVMYIYIPHFSTHELEIFAASQEINIIYIGLAFAVGLAAGVALTYLVFRVRKNSG